MWFHSNPSIHLHTHERMKKSRTTNPNSVSLLRKESMEGIRRSNRYVTIKGHVDGSPHESDLEVKSEEVSVMLEPGSREVVVKNLYVSIDPYQLNRMKSYSSSHTASAFSLPIVPGQPVDAYGVGKVVDSDNPEFEKDDLVVGVITWGDYCLIKPNGSMLKKLDPLGFPLSHHIGILGFSGLTAYGGLFEVCKPKKGEKVFVSAASGSVGNLVGQYAKLFGCHVVGCAGTKDKVALLKDKLGFDDAFNYKEETNLNSALKRYFPEGIDIYFDNVGGEMQEAVVVNMNLFGRVAVCGAISEYTDGSKRAAPKMVDVIYKRIKIQGFLAGDFFNIFPEFLEKTSDYLRSGQIHPLEDISIGIESLPSAFLDIFQGNNVGKKIVKIGQE